MPRKGKGHHLAKLNEFANSVNKFLKTLTSSESSLDFIDLTDSFTNTNGYTVKSLYDTNDSSGMHLGQNGKDKQEIIVDYLKFTNYDVHVGSSFKTPVPDRKHNLGEITITPTSPHRKTKPTKTGNSDETNTHD